jgi:L-aminopeptidase/D-esterase-like protein
MREIIGSIFPKIGVTMAINKRILKRLGLGRGKPADISFKDPGVLSETMEMNSEILKRLGLRIGHYTDERSLTGTTVFIAEQGADVGIDIRGSYTGSLNTPAFDPKAFPSLAHGIVLAGGSDYGLESAFGVMQYLEEKKVEEIPGIVGGVIYDLEVGNAKIRPKKEDGYSAAYSASFNDLRQGNVGVGTGAITGKWSGGKKLKGGFGMACVQMPCDILVSAFVVTNAVGDVINPCTGEFYADGGNYMQLFEEKDDFIDLREVNNIKPSNTTLAVIATNVVLERSQLTKVAELAHDGMARAIFPVHTMRDGDMIFATSSFSSERKKFDNVPVTNLINVVGIGAGNALMKAIKNSMLHAKSIKGYPSYFDNA